MNRAMKMQWITIARWTSQPFNPADIIRKHLPIVVFLIAATILLFGWVLNIPFFRGGVDSANIKVTTTLFFLTSSSIFIAKYYKCRLAEWILWFYHIFWLTMLTVMPFISTFINTLFQDSSKFSLAPQVASPASMTCFWLITIGSVIKPTFLKHRYISKICGGGVLSMAVSAIIGHLIGNPALYFYSITTTGMSYPTALLFVPLAFTLIEIKS